MDLPAWDSFDEDEAEGFYLGDGGDELRTTADATLLLDGGGSLRAHSQVLSLQSRVLRSLAAARAEGGVSAAPTSSSGRPLRKASQGGGSKPGPGSASPSSSSGQLEVPLQGCTLPEAAHFLRLVYCPQDATPANLGGIQDILPGVARLAHQLHVPWLLPLAVGALQAAAAKTTSRSRLLEWADLAQQLHQDDLLGACMRRLAELLVDGIDGDKEAQRANARPAAQASRKRRRGQVEDTASGSSSSSSEEESSDDSSSSEEESSEEESSEEEEEVGTAGMDKKLERALFDVAGLQQGLDGQTSGALLAVLLTTARNMKTRLRERTSTFLPRP